MNLRCRIGYLFVTPDPDSDRSKGGIIYPNNLKDKARTGLCLLHCLSSRWDEIDLTNQRIIFDRWAGRPFRLKWSDGKEYEFVSVSQWAVLAVLDEPEAGDPAFCGFCRGKCKGEHYISPSTEGY